MSNWDTDGEDEYPSEQPSARLRRQVIVGITVAGMILAVALPLFAAVISG